METAADTERTVELARNNLRQCEAYRPANERDSRQKALNLEQIKAFLRRHG